MGRQAPARGAEGAPQPARVPVAQAAAAPAFQPALGRVRHQRPHSGGRTAPSAHDWEEIDVYVCLESGLYVYDAARHALSRRSAQDIRAATGLQDFVARAPVNLVYVADLSRMDEATAEEKTQYAGPDAGFIAQNVYLYCASEGLATVVRGLIDRPALAARMGLSAEQRIILAQSVGYPAAP
jgi:nitroreductase